MPHNFIIIDRLDLLVTRAQAKGRIVWFAKTHRAGIVPYCIGHLQSVWLRFRVKISTAPGADPVTACLRGSKPEIDTAFAAQVAKGRRMSGYL